MLEYFQHDERPGKPLALAHRGFSLDGLENSLAAFRAAAELGFVHLETDVHTTADGVLLVFHDQTLDRVTDSTGKISELTAAEVSQARIGGIEPVPTLVELLEAVPNAKLNLDVKDSGSVETLAALIEEHGLHHRVLVASFSDKRRRAVLKRLSRRTASSGGMLTTAVFVLFGGLLPDRMLRRILRDVDVFQVPRNYGRLKVVTAARVARAHRLDVQIHVWTINDAPTMHKLLDLGVDGIVSDRADILREVLEARGDWL
ncbi:glycerophosphodiester phosphodiesterase [Pseudarthrobacter sp. J1738]|uniref:glycerophosphodiester phosphodiesterase n=1 Tax=unclassified Pseudarthrobacter TaxID=2647000 RepID=UPI003D29CD12